MHRPLPPSAQVPAHCRLPRTGQARRDALLGAVRLVVHVLVRAYLALFHRFRAHNAGQLRHLRCHLIVANHASHLDALALLAAFPLRQVPRVRVLCAKDYFLAHPWRQRITSLLANTIPMDRHRVDRQLMASLREEMGRGANVVLFAEGTRSATGRLGAFRGGVGLLALRCDLPVLPAAVLGTFECCPKGRPVPRPGPIEVAFGQPVCYRGPAKGKRRWLAVARAVRRRVAGLIRQRRPQEIRHERTATPHGQGPRPHSGRAQRRRPHRPRARAHFGQDAGLRLPQSAIGQAVVR